MTTTKTTTIGGGTLTVTPKDKPYNEIQNNSLFAVIKNDGSVVTWPKEWDANTYPKIYNNTVTTQLSGALDVVQIFSNSSFFSALRSDGSIFTWGGGYILEDGYPLPNNIITASSKLNGDINVVQVFSNDHAFAALRIDGSTVTFGDSRFGGDSSSVATQINGDIDVIKIYSSVGAFAALRADGSVITWGSPDYGADSSLVANEIDGNIDVVQIASTKVAFAALKADGSVVTWSWKNYGKYVLEGDSSSVATEINGNIDVVQIASTIEAFAALRIDGSVITWGSSGAGGDSSSVFNQIDGKVDVTEIFSNGVAFAALKADGSVVTWGSKDAGGDSNSVSNQLNGTVDVVKIFSNLGAFAALRNDGSVVTWGTPEGGGDSNVYYVSFNGAYIKDHSIENELNGDIDVIQIFTTDAGAFAALRADGSVITWGNPSYGGNSSLVAKELNGENDVIQITSTRAAFAALRADGSVITWGDSNYGGDSSSVATKLQSNVVAFANATTDDIYTAPLNFTPTGNVTISGTATQNQTLTASNTLADTDGLGVILYQWFSDDKAISNATQTIYTLSQSDVGKKITVKANYTDTLGTAEIISSAATTAVANINDTPTGTVTINGQAKQNQILTASNTLTDTDGLGAITYQWQSNSKDIANATQVTYQLTQADVGNVITVKANYTDAQGAKESVTSSATAKIENVNDSPTGTISISELAAQGQTLTSVSTLADIDGLGAFKYQWLRNGTTISGATKSTYVLGTADVGKTMSVKISYTDLLGTTENVTSQSTLAVISTKPSKGNDLLTGTAKNDTISALAGDDTLIGGTGADKLTGGLGADTFKFTSMNDSGITAKTRDTITDFNSTQNDKIDLSSIDADTTLAGNQAFTLINSATFSADATGQLRFDEKTHILYASTNADSNAEISISLTGVKSLSIGDFVL